MQFNNRLPHMLFLLPGAIFSKFHEFRGEFYLFRVISLKAAVGHVMREGERKRGERDQDRRSRRPNVFIVLVFLIAAA
jgi:hypothetical protein